jgi:acyl-CoA dehydrogenase
VLSPHVSEQISGRTLLATILAALISGATRAVFEQSLQYANERQQFGRSIGKFQAIQHRLAVMAEHVAAAQMAARLAWDRLPLGSDPLRVAVAKARCSEAAVAVAEAAHAIHGAMGFTEACSLQLWTGRLRAWRNAAGTESYWHSIAGRVLLGSPRHSTLDAIRRVTDGPCRPAVRHQETLQCPS